MTLSVAEGLWTKKLDMDTLHHQILEHSLRVFGAADRTSEHHATDKDTIRRSIAELEKFNRWMFLQRPRIHKDAFSDVMQHLSGSLERLS